MGAAPGPMSGLVSHGLALRPHPSFNQPGSIFGLTGGDPSVAICTASGCMCSVVLWRWFGAHNSRPTGQQHLLAQAVGVRSA